jgi:hypothetical protein
MEDRKAARKLKLVEEREAARLAGLKPALGN